MHRLGWGQKILILRRIYIFACCYELVVLVCFFLKKVSAHGNLLFYTLGDWAYLWYFIAFNSRIVLKFDMLATLLKHSMCSYLEIIALHFCHMNMIFSFWVNMSLS